MNTVPDWVKYIEKRAQLSIEWRAKFSTQKKLAESCFYIRIGGDKYRPISISPDNPCGRLIRKEKGTVLGGSKKIENAIQSVEKVFPANYYEPDNAKPEHKMQAALICEALMHDLYLQGLFDGFTDIFDELLFVTDELSAGEIRADMIALGGKAGKYFPIFIELKAKRTLKVVIEQLDRAKKAMEVADRHFIDLLSNVTGKPKAEISFDKACLLIVWPDSHSGRENVRVSAARVDGYLTATYMRNGRVVRGGGG